MMKAFAGTPEREKAIIQTLLTDTKKDTIKQIAKQYNVKRVVYRAIDEHDVYPISLEFVFVLDSLHSGDPIIEARNAFMGANTLNTFDYVVQNTEACHQLNSSCWHTLYYEMSFCEFALGCTYGTSIGSFVLSGIKELFPNDYKDVLKEYNKNILDSLESKAKALSYLLAWLSDKGIPVQLAEKVDNSDQISGMLGVIMTDNEWHALQHDWATFCKTPEKFKGTAVTEMVHAWLNDMRNSDEVGATEEPSVKSEDAARVPLPDHLQPYQQEGPELLPPCPPKRLEFL